MSYPFGAVCLRDLVPKLIARGCTEVTVKPPGPPPQPTWRGLKRVNDRGDTLVVALPEVGESDVLHPNVLRSIVERLDLNPAEFGYALSSTDVDDDEDDAPTTGASN